MCLLIMSLLDRIKKKKTELNSCDTIVTLPSGLVYKERLSPNGEITFMVLSSENSPGFVVDTKPDLQVALVLPGLLMGSQDVLLEETILQNYSITHILSLGIKPHDGLSNRYKCYFIEALDVPETNLLPILKQSILFIDEVRNLGGCVFVHCNAGVSRSASIVIGYLIKEGMTFCQAYQYLKERREVIKPNDGFVQQLKDNETEIRKYQL